MRRRVVVVDRAGVVELCEARSSLFFSLSSSLPSVTLKSLTFSLYLLLYLGTPSYPLFCYLFISTLALSLALSHCFVLFVFVVSSSICCLFLLGL